jgi:hypothetical protein
MVDVVKGQGSNQTLQKLVDTTASDIEQRMLYDPAVNQRAQFNGSASSKPADIGGFDDYPIYDDAIQPSLAQRAKKSIKKTVRGIKRDINSLTGEDVAATTATVLTGPAISTYNIVKGNKEPVEKPIENPTQQPFIGDSAVDVAEARIVDQDNAPRPSILNIILVPGIVWIALLPFIVD